MKQQRQFQQLAINLIQQGLKTAHGRIVLGGLLVGLCYFPVWLGFSFMWALQGTTDLLVAAGLAYLGLYRLWQQRRRISKLCAPPEDRLLGHLLILSGMVMFPFCFFAVWAMAASWLVVLLGIACSSWGITFFKKYPLSSSLIAISTYSAPGAIAVMLWQTFTPPQIIERFMAWSGAIALRIIGQPAIVENTTIALPQGGVEVAWGCNGFDMAFTMAAASFMLGLFLKQPATRIWILVATGIVLAFIFNIPRIMLLTFASVYWGEASFKFWHGPIGGQVFSTVLFTVYYYTVMGIINRRPANRSLP